MDQKKKIIFMVAGIGLLLVGFLLFMFNRPGSEQPATVTEQQPSTTMPAPSNGAMPDAPPSMPDPGSGSMNAGMTPVTAPAPPPVPRVRDPFAGGPGRIIPPPKVETSDDEYLPDQPDMIPLYEIPNVNTDGGPIRWERGAVNTKLRDASINLGRTAGWIANDARGRVVAYFEMQDGSMRTATVDSVIDGYRVKAINLEQQYLLLIHLQSGREERVTLQGSRRAQ